MKFTKYINFKAFLVSFAVGLLYIYLTDDYKKVIIVYPTPMNKDKKLYVDKANNCFKYGLTQAECLSNKEEYVNVGVNY
jgi:hypothetical protein